MARRTAQVNRKLVRRNGEAGRRGFTLIELLAVLAVVFILLLGASVTFRKAREMALATACRSNLHQWAGAFHAYAADHQGRFPHTDDWTRADKSGLSVEESPHNHCWVDVLPPYMGMKAWRDHPEGERPTRNPWQCPAAVYAEDKDYRYPRSRTGSFTYAMNSYLSYDFDYGGLHGGESYLNTLRCTAPAQTILLFEQAAAPTDGLYPQYSNREAGRYPGEDVTALTCRHRRVSGEEGSNFLFIDGHVAWRNDIWVRQHSDFPSENDDLEWFPYPYK